MTRKPYSPSGGFQKRRKYPSLTLFHAAQNTIKPLHKPRRLSSTPLEISLVLRCSITLQTELSIMHKKTMISMQDKLKERLSHILPSDAQRMLLVELSKIHPNPDQPRKIFDE